MQPLRDGGREGVRGGRVGQAPELPEQVAHRQIGGGAAIGQAVAFAVGHRLPGQTLSEFRQQPRLAQAGLPRNADHLPLPSDRLRQPLVQQRQFPGPPHKATQGPRAALRDARPPPQEAMHHIPRPRGGRGVMGASRPGLALDLRLHQRVGGGAAQDGVGRGLLLEPRGPGERVAARRVEPLRVLLPGGRPPPARCAAPG